MIGYTDADLAFFQEKGGRVQHGGYNAVKGAREVVINFGLMAKEEAGEYGTLAKPPGYGTYSVPKYKIPTRGTAGEKWCAWWPVLRLPGDAKLPSGHFLTFDQKQGSCVGNGGGQAGRYRNAFEVYAGDMDKLIVPFWLLAYGKSREFGGLNNRGDGSFGSTMARAMREIGMPDAGLSTFPRWDDQGGRGLTWGARAELDYSVGRNLAADELALAKNHLVLEVEQVTSLDALEAAILIDGKTATCASNWGGSMQCPVKGGDHPVLLNARRGTWMHQMCILACWHHPTLSRIWYILNSWSISAHGTPPDDSPPGGFWVQDRDMGDIVGQDEVFVLGGYQGVKVDDLTPIEVANLRSDSEARVSRVTRRARRKVQYAT